MRFELITLTVFVMIFMIEELASGSCPVGQFSWSGHCFNCQCKWENTKIKGSCKGDGSCTCDDAYMPPTCVNCKRSYYTLSHGGGCAPCGCDKYGSTGVECSRRVGQGSDLFCNCRTGYKGRQCDICGDTYFPSNGACCDKQDKCFSKSQSICIDCAANAARCDVSKCECKQLFTGKECNGAKVTEINLGKVRVNSIGISYKAIVIHCNGNCHIVDIQSSFSNGIGMYASPEKFRHQFPLFDSSGTLFCTSVTQRGRDECAKPGILKGNKFYLLFFGRQNFDNRKVRIRVGNFVKYEEQSL